VAAQIPVVDLEMRQQLCHPHWAWGNTLKLAHWRTVDFLDEA